MSAAPPGGGAQRRRRLLAGGAGALAVVLLLASAAVFWRDREAALRQAVVLPPGVQLQAAQTEAAQRLPAFTLVGLDGPLPRAALQGRWTYVFFGYTSCPDACPQALATLSQVQQRLRAQGRAVPRVLFVSFDPQRDTPGVLRGYLAAFDVDALGASGEAAALQPLLAFFGVSVERHDGAGSGNYSFDHTANVFLVSPDGRWLATFPPTADAAALVGDTRILVSLAD